MNKKASTDKAKILSEKWHIPLSRDKHTLKQGLAQIKPFSLVQNDIPLIIKLVENPKYDIGLFAGYVDLFAHDCIHILLSRGLLLKDDAFVIGYTMGSTKKMRRWRRNLFYFCSKYLYPEGYKFTEEERFVFLMGIMAGSTCKTDLSVVNFNKFKNKQIRTIRKELEIDKDLLKNCYEIEKRLFPDSKESQRLI